MAERYVKTQPQIIDGWGGRHSPEPNQARRVGQNTAEVMAQVRERGVAVGEVSKGANLTRRGSDTHPMLGEGRLHVLFKVRGTG